MLGLILSAAIALLWWHYTRQCEPIVTLCRCGDLVQHVPMWPTQCPSCKGLII